MYTLQTHFLLRNPVQLSPAYFSLVTVLGFVGYYVFRTVNNQKDLVRATNGKCVIWGKPARYIRTSFSTSDGKVHGSLLLTSGYWGISRHFNYVGDLLLSLAMCMTCGVGFILPYFYIVYMAILLVQRIERDHERCHGKVILRIDFSMGSSGINTSSRSRTSCCLTSTRTRINRVRLRLSLRKKKRHVDICTHLTQ